MRRTFQEGREFGSRMCSRCREHFPEGQWVKIAANRHRCFGCIEELKQKKLNGEMVRIKKVANSTGRKRKTKPHNCACGETSPDMFYSGHKSTCKVCSKAKAKAFQQAIVEERKIGADLSCVATHPILHNRLISARGRAEQRGMEFDLTNEWIVSQFEAQDGKCTYCNTEMDIINGGLHSASLDRIDSSVGYLQSNCQLISTFVNRWKSNHSEEEFVTLVKMLHDGIYS